MATWEIFFVSQMSKNEMQMGSAHLFQSDLSDCGKLPHPYGKSSAHVCQSVEVLRSHDNRKQKRWGQGCWLGGSGNAVWSQSSWVQTLNPLDDLFFYFLFFYSQIQTEIRYLGNDSIGSLWYKMRKPVGRADYRAYHIRNKCPKMLLWWMAEGTGPWTWKFWPTWMCHVPTCNQERHKGMRQGGNAGEVARELRAYTVALAEHLSSVPSTHVRWLTPGSNLSHHGIWHRRPPGCVCGCVVPAPTPTQIDIIKYKINL